jgi:L-Ala-D/L-Glu epimerase
MLREVTAHGEHWLLSRPFRIARGSKTAADVLVVEVRAAGLLGRGEAVPYARYEETLDATLQQIRQVSGAVGDGAGRDDLLELLPAGAARNALDAALWDLESQQRNLSVAQLIGQPEPAAIATAVTVSLDTPAAMGSAALALRNVPLLKVKVDATDPLSAIRAVREAAPDAGLIVDPNESWSPELLCALAPALAELRVDVVEQPVHADEDGALAGLALPVALAADESAHVTADLERVARAYQIVNIKLDKTGGLTEALRMRQRATELGLRLMTGCMIGTSLAIAPAFHLAQHCEFVDLDGPWWLGPDRLDGFRIADGYMEPAPGLWGQGRR